MQSINQSLFRHILHAICFLSCFLSWRQEIPASSIELFQGDPPSFKAGFTRTTQAHEHKHKSRVNLDDVSTSTSARYFFVCLCLRRPSSHVAYACAHAYALISLRRTCKSAFSITKIQRIFPCTNLISRARGPWLCCICRCYCKVWRMSTPVGKDKLELDWCVGEEDIGFWFCFALVLAWRWVPVLLPTNRTSSGRTLGRLLQDTRRSL